MTIDPSPEPLSGAAVVETVTSPVSTTATAPSTAPDEQKSNVAVYQVEQPSSAPLPIRAELKPSEQIATGQSNAIALK